ncbi:hypothetical protein Tco_1215122 [Tanacetum coccineum]
MTRSSTKELLSPLENPERVLRSRRKLFDNPSLVELNPPEDDQLSEIEEHIEEEVTEIMAETMEQYMSKTREDYGGSEQEDANEHIEKVLEIVDLFHIPKVTQDQIMLRAFPVSLTRAASRWLRNQPSGSITTWEVLKTKFLNKYCPPARTAKKMEEINNFQQEPDESLFRAWERFKELLMKCPQHYLTDMQEVILFYNGLDVPTRQILDSKGAIPSKTAAAAKTAIQEMAEYSQKWHNGTSSRTRSTETSDGLAAIQAQLNNLRREIKKVNEKVYAAQVGCELCKGPHYTKDCPQKEEGKTLEEAYYTQFGAPYQPGGQYRAAGPGFYQRNNRNSSSWAFKGLTDQDGNFFQDDLGGGNVFQFGEVGGNCIEHHNGFGGHTEDDNFGEELDETMLKKDAIQQAGNVSPMASTSPQARNVSIDDFFAEFDALKNQVSLIKKRKFDEFDELTNNFSKLESS